MNKITTSAYQPWTSGGVERLNHTMALMLAMVVNEQQANWDEQLPHVESAYNNSANAATGLTPPTKYTSAAFRAFPSPSSISPTWAGTKASTGTNWLTSTSPPAVNNERVASSANTTPSPSRA